MARWIKNEFWNGYNWLERAFLLSMVLLQVIVYCFTPDTPIGMVCGISGVICVVLTAKGKISSYIFNFIQMITYMIICWNAALYLEFGEQVFYFIACIFGVFLWKKNMVKNEDGTDQVIAKKFKPWHWVATVVVTAVSTVILGYFGDNILGSTLSYLDAFTVALLIRLIVKKFDPFGQAEVNYIFDYVFDCRTCSKGQKIDRRLDTTALVNESAFDSCFVFGSHWLAAVAQDVRIIAPRPCVTLIILRSIGTVNEFAKMIAESIRDEALFFVQIPGKHLSEQLTKNRSRFVYTDATSIFHLRDFGQLFFDQMRKLRYRRFMIGT